jgi:DNA-binding NtrC family response regulator
MTSDVHNPPASIAPIRTVLLIDDDPRVIAAVAQVFALRGWKTISATDGRAGIALYDEARPDLVMLDLGMSGLNGMQVLQILRDHDPDATVIMLSGEGDINTAVEAMQLGAEAFLEKPFVPRHLTAVVERAYEKSVLRRRNHALAQRQVRESNLESLGSSPAMQAVAREIVLLSAGSAPILLVGETGSGKGWIAKLIHAASPRRAAPFVSINCAGLSSSFLDTELFGHEKGAFTDAKTQKQGLFEVADGGTLMLDEIGDLAPDLQPKLLTVLETRRFRRLGGTREIEVDVRLIAATHVDLAEAVRNGRFREDLYYRIAGLPVRIPALRERGRDEVAHLALQLFGTLRQQLGRGPERISADAMAQIVQYQWPGNVRELRNVLERALLLSVGEEELEPRHLPSEMRPRVAVRGDASNDLSLETAERAHIERVLVLAGRNRMKAAKLLGMSRQTLYNRLNEYGLSDE